MKYISKKICKHCSNLWPKRHNGGLTCKTTHNDLLYCLFVCSSVVLRLACHFLPSLLFNTAYDWLFKVGGSLELLNLTGSPSQRRERRRGTRKRVECGVSYRTAVKRLSLFPLFSSLSNIILTGHCILPLSPCHPQPSHHVPASPWTLPETSGTLDPWSHIYPAWSWSHTLTTCPSSALSPRTQCWPLTHKWHHSPDASKTWVGLGVNRKKRSHIHWLKRTLALVGPGMSEGWVYLHLLNDTVPVPLISRKCFVAFKWLFTGVDTLSSIPEYLCW